ncbi:hypothetical protein [Nocardia carnea]|uniref:hypothetical protein n=1 Tax=Nocardia carnea TaxID=37328 RepID=UPI0024565DC0|nr:hypothetical protein [Nocardia carnea]
MRTDVHYTCSIRGCSDTATDTYTFTWQNRPRRSVRCRRHYLQALQNERAIAEYDPIG